MDKRRVYIITTLIILSLLAALAIWYAYVVRQEEQLTKPKIIEPAEFTVPPRIISDTDTNNGTDTTQPTATDTEGETSSTNNNPESLSPAGTNTIIQPDNWTLSNISQEPTLNFSIDSDIVTYTNAKLGTVSTYNTTSNEPGTISQETLPDLRGVYQLTDVYSLVIPKFDRPYIINLTDEEAGTTIYDTILQVVQTDDAVYYMGPNDTGINIKKIKYKDLTKDPLPITEIWSSPLSGWILQSYNDGIYITQKASNGVPGYAYKLSDKGVLSKLAGDKPALITNLSPDGKTLLYSTVKGSDITLNLKDLNSGDVTPLYTITLASKCAWASDSITLYCAVPNNLKFIKELPDSWYKGKAHLSDNLWRINTKTGEALELVRYMGLDAVEMQPLGESGMVFKDKTSQTLWSIIKEQREQQTQ